MIKVPVAVTGAKTSFSPDLVIVLFRDALIRTLVHLARCIHLHLIACGVAACRRRFILRLILNPVAVPLFEKVIKNAQKNNKDRKSSITFEVRLRQSESSSKGHSLSVGIIMADF